MKYVLCECHQSVSGDIHDQEIAVFTSKEKLDAFYENNKEHMKNGKFFHHDYCPLPLDPETFAEIDYHNYKEGL